MGELLLELLSEEIPARMQRRAINDLTGLIRDKLAAAEIPAATLHGYVTPRRLTVIADGIPESQPDRSEERRGPRVGAPQQAIEGFLRSSGLASIEQCEMRDTGRGEFYFATLHQPGRAAAEVLPELLHAAIAELPWPKSMRYPAASLRWVRPLVSAICLLDGQVLPLSLDRVPVGRTTRGHRFLSEGEIAVENAADYRAKLEAAHVMLDHERRRDVIAADLDRLAAVEGVRVKSDAGLLDEVSGLVEYPVVLIGAIDDASMALPSEVLATAMRTHQKYFSCLHPDGTTAPRFLFVANNKTPNDGKTIAAGNERVLRARLADARFFWDQDRKVPLASRVEALKRRVYYDKLGSMYDKTMRIEKLAQFLSVQLTAGARSAPVGSTNTEVGRASIVGELSSPNNEGLIVVHAAHLAKADLLTGTVGEFPELQGVMGRYYALHDGEDTQVANAIADHYKPQGPSDACPTAPVSVAVALADKIDSLTAFFAVGEKPSGSRDPFALRRAVQGIIRIILENELRLSLAVVFVAATEQLPVRPENPQAFVQDLLDFIEDRLKVHLRDQGIRHDQINAVLVRPEANTVLFGEALLGYRKYRRDDDLVRVLARAHALKNFLASDDGTNLLIAYRRASNIVMIEEKRDNRLYFGEVSRDLFKLSEEGAVVDALTEASTRAATALTNEEFEKAMSALSALRHPVDEFFNKVTVNAEDQDLRRNRLHLLSSIRTVMNQVADFSQIEG